MKRVTVILVLAMLVALSASPLMAAGIPGTINLQGRLTDVAGSNLTDGVHTLAFKVYADSVGGSALWSETLPVQVTGGLFTVTVGNSSAIPPDIFSNAANRFLGVTVNLEPEMPRIRLNSVAYAYQTQDADEATLALNLTCVGCVSAGEIAVDAVGPAEIAPAAVVGGLGGDVADGTITFDDLGTNSVGSAEIATGAVGTAEVLNGSLTVNDIGDEPGVASNTRTTGIDMDGTVETLLSRTINCPAAGYVLVIASAEVTISHTTGFFSAARFGVSTSAGNFADNQSLEVAITGNAPTGTYRQAVTVHGLFSTPGGLDTYYFLGDESSVSDITLTDLQLSLIYFPTAYGTVVSTAAPGGAELSSESADPDAQVVSAGVVSDPDQAQATTSMDFQQELALIKAEMEARIQQLEASFQQSQSGTEEK